MTSVSPSNDNVPAIDQAEVAKGHPHTDGVEYTDDETLISDDVAPDVVEFGENPDVETHDYEEPRSL